MTARIDVTTVTPQDLPWIAARAAALWGDATVVTRGRVHHVTKLPGFIARIDDQPAGFVVYRLDDDSCELVAIEATRPRVGVGTALLAAVARAAADRRLWLITTNDNLDALRFYQRRGFVLGAVYPGAVYASRRIKPQIPRVGAYGIPLRDELELVYTPQNAAPAVRA